MFIALSARYGDLVCPNDQHWYLFMLLLQIVNIVFSPVISTGITIYLKHLIAEHRSLFKHLFPDKNLLPKHGALPQLYAENWTTATFLMHALRSITFLKSS